MEVDYVLVGAFGGLAIVSAFLLYRLFSVFTDFEIKMHALEERLKTTESALRDVRVRTVKIRQAQAPKADYKQVEKRLNEAISKLVKKVKVANG